MHNSNIKRVTKEEFFSYLPVPKNSYYNFSEIRQDYTHPVLRNSYIYPAPVRNLSNDTDFFGFTYKVDEDEYHYYIDISILHLIKRYNVIASEPEPEFNYRTLNTLEDFKEFEINEWVTISSGYEVRVDNKNIESVDYKGYKFNLIDLKVMYDQRIKFIFMENTTLRINFKYEKNIMYVESEIQRSLNTSYNALIRYYEKDNVAK